MDGCRRPVVHVDKRWAAAISMYVAGQCCERMSVQVCGTGRVELNSPVCRNIVIVVDLVTTEVLTGILTNGGTEEWTLHKPPGIYYSRRILYSRRFDFATQFSLTLGLPDRVFRHSWPMSHTQVDITEMTQLDLPPEEWMSFINKQSIDTVNEFRWSFCMSGAGCTGRLYATPQRANDMCALCDSRPTTVMTIPCNHLTTCGTCFNPLAPLCLVCGDDITVSFVVHFNNKTIEF